MYKCPNCGAAFTGRNCEYCGTINNDFKPETIKDNKPVRFFGVDISAITNKITSAINISIDKLDKKIK